MPIALDTIKQRIDDGEYESLKDVKQDLETCFRNAKRYNSKESQIFQDAKVLHVRSILINSFDRNSTNIETR